MLWFRNFWFWFQQIWKVLRASDTGGGFEGVGGFRLWFQLQSKSFRNRFRSFRNQFRFRNRNRASLIDKYYVPIHKFPKWKWAAFYTLVICHPFLYLWFPMVSLDMAGLTKASSSFPMCMAVSIDLGALTDGRTDKHYQMYYLPAFQPTILRR